MLEYDSNKRIFWDDIIIDKVFAEYWEWILIEFKFNKINTEFLLSVKLVSIFLDIYI